jgi:hypothetical protein
VLQNTIVFFPADSFKREINFAARYQREVLVPAADGYDSREREREKRQRDDVHHTETTSE